MTAPEYAYEKGKLLSAPPPLLYACIPRRGRIIWRLVSSVVEAVVAVVTVTAVMVMLMLRVVVQPPRPRRARLRKITERRDMAP